MYMHSMVFIETDVVLMKNVLSKMNCLFVGIFVMHHILCIFGSFHCTLQVSAASLGVSQRDVLDIVIALFVTKFLFMHILLKDI